MTDAQKKYLELLFDGIIGFAAGAIAFSFFGDGSQPLMSQPIATAIGIGVGIAATKAARQHKMLT